MDDRQPFNGLPGRHLANRHVVNWSGALIAVLLLTACANSPAALSEAASAPTAPAATAPMTATAGPTEQATVVLPEASVFPLTDTTAPTSTPTPSSTPTPTHPLMIEVMRQQSYPGSEIVFEQVLEPGANYNRYIISYQSEGNKIYALLTIPWGERPATGWPVIIFNHGYIPPEQYRTTERYVAYVDNIARHGYIVLRSDYRGHGSSEGEPAGAYGSPAYTIDVLNAVASIKQYPDADPDRIGMWGHSMGGYITLRSMVITDDIKAGVIWGGVVASYPDLIQNWRRGDGPTRTPDPNSTRRRWRDELLETYGDFDENPEFWAAISANSYLADLSGPVQLHHGTADTSVPYEFSETLTAQITTVGLPVDLYLWNGDDHNISASFTPAMQRSIEFFDRYVKGEG